MNSLRTTACLLSKAQSRLLRSIACRGLASSANAAAVKPSGHKKIADFDMGKLVKPLEAEIEFNEKFVAAEDLKLAAVEENFAKLLKDQCWSVNALPDSTLVEMRTQRGDMDIVVRFDAELVAQNVNAGSQEVNEEEDDVDEETEDAIEEEEEDMDFNEDDEMGPQPFNFTLELRRAEALPGKFVELELEAIPGPISGGQADEVYINSIAIRHEDEATASQAYAGPEFTSLDESLRDTFDAWATKNVRQLVPFIVEYSKAKEAQEYGQWLSDLKTFASPN